MLKAFGSYGAKIWQGIKSRAQPIREALKIGRDTGRDLAASDLQREYRKVIKLEGVSEKLAALDPGSYVPGQLWTEAEIPMKRPFGYEVTISGRDLATGRYARTTRRLAFSRELTVEEVLEVADERFSTAGAYPQLDVTHLGRTGAFVRPGEGLV